MKCPHCGFWTPNYKYEGWNSKARPLIGAFSLCLECGGYSVFIGDNQTRKATKQEFDRIRNQPEILLLGRIRKYYFRLHQQCKDS